MLSHGNVCILLLYEYPYFVAMSKHRTDCTYETWIWRCDRQRLVHLQYLRYQSSQIFRTTKLNDCKNLTFNAVSFFLLDAEYFWSLSSLWQKLCPQSVSPARSEQALHIIVVIFLYHYRFHTCKLMISSPKIEQSSWSTMWIVRSVMLRTMNGR